MAKAMPGFVLHGEEAELPRFSLPHGSQLTAENVPFVLQWGIDALAASKAPVPVLNGQEGLANVADPERMRTILSVNGLPPKAEAAEHKWLRQYVVFVFQLTSCRVPDTGWTPAGQSPAAGCNAFCGGNGYGRQPGSQTRPNLCLAGGVRAGPRCGTGAPGPPQKRGWAVLDVKPSPPLPDLLVRRLERQLALYEANLQRDRKRTRPVLLGADPEFMLRDGRGQLILASRFFPRRGGIGCDQLWLRGDKTRTRLPIGEVRPRPAEEPKDLLRDLIRNLLLGVRRVTRSDVAWVAGGMPFDGYPIGGHLHFSRVSANSHLLRALDNYLALPLACLESPASRARRPKYGFLGDWRPQEHGGFEYRTLPSWLVSPTIAKGVIVLAKLIAEHYLALRKLPLAEPDAQRAFYEGDRETLRLLLPEVRADIERLPSFARYASTLNAFFDLAQHGDPWEETADIRKAWQLPPFARNASSPAKGGPRPS
jgi:hypothetical protein